MMIEVKRENRKMVYELRNAERIDIRWLMIIVHGSDKARVTDMAPIGDAKRGISNRLNHMCAKRASTISMRIPDLTV